MKKVDQGDSKMTVLKVIMLSMFLICSFGCFQRTAKSSRTLDLGMSKAEVQKSMGYPTKKSAYVNDNGDKIEVWHFRETTWDDGGWSWDKTIVRSNIIFKNGFVDAIGQDPEQYKSKNPFNPAVRIEVDQTVRNRN